MGRVASSDKVQKRATEWRGRHSAGQIILPNPSNPEWVYLNGAGHAACCPFLNAPEATRPICSSRAVLVYFGGKSTVNEIGEQFALLMSRG